MSKDEEDYALPFTSRGESHGGYVVVKAKGGMGNRMLCAASGILYAEITGRTPILDWSDGVYGPPGRNVFESFFDCAGTQTFYPDSPGMSVWPPVWRGHLQESVVGMICKFDPDKHSSRFIHQKYSVDVRKVTYSEDVLVFWNYMDRINRLRRHFTRGSTYVDLSREQILRKFLKERMRLIPAIRRQVEDFKRQHWTDNVIGVHVRHTDRKISVEKYVRPLRRLFEGHQPTIFLATDDANVEQQFEREFNKVVSTKKWYPSSTIALHRSTERFDRTLTGIEALVDMYLLAECHHLIFPENSTFSWISSLLIEAPKGNIINVERWNLKNLANRWTREIIP